MKKQPNQIRNSSHNIPNYQEWKHYTIGIFIRIHSASLFNIQ